jgi:heat shock protein HslJ
MNPEYADRFGRSISVDRFVRARPELTCERQRTTAALFNTYWKIDELRGDPLVTPDAGREPHIVLLRGELGRFRATVGCNQLIGSVTASREALSFGRQGAATLKACPQPFDALERELAGVLSETRNYRGTGETLLLLDGDGSIVSILTAVYFR